MEILYFCPLWGSEHMELPSFFKRVINTGYDGVEIAVPYDKKFEVELRVLLENCDMKLIGQQYLLPKKETIKEYLNRLEDFLGYLISFDPIFVNSHTGRDFFSFEDNCLVIETINKISNDSDVRIIHETHRGRFNFSTYTTNLYFQKFTELKITADLSHWCCVSESLLEDQEEFLQEAFQRTEHIHARVGYNQSPQVNHPGAPENKHLLDRHLSWWQKIIAIKKKENRDYFTITTEFGPEPYMPVSPFDNKPLADQWEVNLFMKEYLKKNLK